MTTGLYVFAGGGTGGHLLPGLAVAEVLRQRDPAARIEFFTSARRLDGELLGRTAYQQVEQAVRPFSLHPLRWPGFWWSWQRSVRAARARFTAERPKAVLGLGGYAAGPAVVAARRLGVRTAILNPDAIPGRANRHLARYADLVVLQWACARPHFTGGTECQVLGCPVRPQFVGADGLEGRRRLGLLPERPVLVVTGASQGAHTVNEVMLRVWPLFRGRHPEWQMLHISGPADEAAARASYAQKNTPALVLGFAAEMWWALAAADVVVSRAGASTLAELTALGKPSILLPYPYHRDRHQHANARVLVEAGAAVMIEDRVTPALNEGPLLAALERLSDPSIRSAMAAAAAGLGRVTAAAAVADWLMR